jgi:hypothetical protein
MIIAGTFVICASIGTDGRQTVLLMSDPTSGPKIFTAAMILQ